jgi:hypothetical protein
MISPMELDDMWFRRFTKTEGLFLRCFSVGVPLLNNSEQTTRPK